MQKDGVFTPPKQCTKCKNIRWNVSRDAPKVRKPRTKKVKDEVPPTSPEVNAIVEAQEPPKVEVGITVVEPVKDEASE